jgi:hypothetical protein
MVIKSESCRNNWNNYQTMHIVQLQTTLCHVIGHTYRNKDLLFQSMVMYIHIPHVSLRSPP